MGKDKIRRFAQNAEFENVFEPDIKKLVEGDTFMQGKWHSEFFKNDNPITIELGCGGGEYTLGLARMFPERNFIGVDIKGARIWKGAKAARLEGLTNVAFLRTKIEFVQNCFLYSDNVEQIWLTFSDPQPKDERGNKKLTSPKFIERYKKFLKPGGLVHVKTDSTLLYEWTLEALEETAYEVELHNADIYAGFADAQPAPLCDVLNFKTFYERRWLSEGLTIKYIRFRV